MHVALPGAGTLERHLIGDLLKRARVIGRQTVGIQHGGRSAKERCKEHAYGQIGAVVNGVGVVFAPQVKGRIPYGKSNPLSNRLNHIGTGCIHRKSHKHTSCIGIVYRASLTHKIGKKINLIITEFFIADILLLGRVISGI